MSTPTPTDDQRRMQDIDARAAIIVHACRRILEANLEGPSGAAADVVALEGGKTQITVLLGKS